MSQVVEWVRAPPVRAIEFVPPVAVTEPPQLLVRLGVPAMTRLLGSRLVKATPVRSVAV